MKEITQDIIEVAVFKAVCTSLALEPDEVSKDSFLIRDLGMDSLDFLDIMFMLEKELDRKIRDDDFDRVLRPDKNQLAKAAEFLEEKEIAALSPIIPALKTAPDTKKIPRKDLFAYVTVESLVHMVTQKLSGE